MRLTLVMGWECLQVHTCNCPAFQASPKHGPVHVHVQGEYDPLHASKLSVIEMSGKYSGLRDYQCTVLAKVNI